MKQESTNRCVYIQNIHYLPSRELHIILYIFQTLLLFKKKKKDHLTDYTKKLKGNT